MAARVSQFAAEEWAVSLTWQTLRFSTVFGAPVQMELKDIVEVLDSWSGSNYAGIKFVSARGTQRLLAANHLPAGESLADFRATLMRRVAIAKAGHATRETVTAAEALVLDPSAVAVALKRNGTKISGVRILSLEELKAMTSFLDVYASKSTCLALPDDLREQVHAVHLP